MTNFFHTGYGVKTFPFPYSLYELLISKAIDPDWPQKDQAYNFCFVRKSDDLSLESGEFLITIPEKYHYFLTGFRFMAQDVENAVPWRPLVNITFVANGIRYAIDDIQANLITQIQPTTTGKNAWTAYPPRYEIKTPRMLEPGGRLLFKWDNTGTGSGGVQRFEMITEGVLIPQHLTMV